MRALDAVLTENPWRATEFHTSTEATLTLAPSRKNWGTFASHYRLRESGATLAVGNLVRIMSSDFLGADLHARAPFSVTANRFKKCGGWSRRRRRERMRRAHHRRHGNRQRARRASDSRAERSTGALSLRRGPAPPACSTPSCSGRSHPARRSSCATLPRSPMPLQEQLRLAREQRAATNGHGKESAFHGAARVQHDPKTCRRSSCSRLSTRRLYEQLAAFDHPPCAARMRAAKTSRLCSRISSATSPELAPSRRAISPRRRRGAHAPNLERQRARALRLRTNDGRALLGKGDRTNGSLAAARDRRDPAPNPGSSDTACFASACFCNSKPTSWPACSRRRAATSRWRRASPRSTASTCGASSSGPAPVWSASANRHRPPWIARSSRPNPTVSDLRHTRSRSAILASTHARMRRGRREMESEEEMPRGGRLACFAET